MNTLKMLLALLLAATLSNFAKAENLNGLTLGEYLTVRMTVLIEVSARYPELAPRLQAEIANLDYLSIVNVDFINAQYSGNNLVLVHGYSYSPYVAPPTLPTPSPITYEAAQMRAAPTAPPKAKPFPIKGRSVLFR